MIRFHLNVTIVTSVEALILIGCKAKWVAISGVLCVGVCVCVCMVGGGGGPTPELPLPPQKKRKKKKERRLLAIL